MIVLKSFPQAQRWIPYGLLVAAVLTAYANVYDNQFVMDTSSFIVNNLYLRSWHYLGDIFTTSVYGGAGSSSPAYRPLQILLYFIVYQLGGLSLFGYHFLNVGLHTADACLIYALGCRLQFNPKAAFLAALIWGVHPIHVEAITAMDITADPLYTLFCLSGLLVLLPDFSQKRILLSLPFLILGFLSKESMMIFPGLAVCCLFLVSEKRRNFKTYLGTWPLWVITVAYIVLHLMFQGTDVHFDEPIPDNINVYIAHFSVRLYTCLATLPLYMKLLVWPTGLHIQRSFPIYTTPWHIEVMVGLVMVIATFCQIFLFSRGRRGLALSWGLLWWGICLSPETGLAFPANVIVREHWMYLPSAGLFLGSAETLARLSTSLFWHQCQKILACAALGAACLLGVLTHWQNETWQSPFTLYPYILQHEDSFLAVHEFADICARAGQYDASMRLYHRALSMSDTLPDVHVGIAYVLMQEPNWSSHPQEIIAQFERAIAMNPYYVTPYGGLAQVYKVLGDTEKAAKYSETYQDGVPSQLMHWDDFYKIRDYQ